MIAAAHRAAAQDGGRVEDCNRGLRPCLGTGGGHDDDSNASPRFGTGSVAGRGRIRVPCWCWASRTRQRQGEDGDVAGRDSSGRRLPTDLDGTLRGARSRLSGSPLLLRAAADGACARTRRRSPRTPSSAPTGRLATYPAERIRALALRPWLYRITLNVARNRFRGKKLRTVSLDHPIPAGSDQTWEPPARSGGAAGPRSTSGRGERQDIAALMAGASGDGTGRRCILRYVEGLRSTRSRPCSASRSARRNPTSTAESTPCARPCRGLAGKG